MTQEEFRENIEYLDIFQKKRNFVEKFVFHENANYLQTKMSMKRKTFLENVKRLLL